MRPPEFWNYPKGREGAPLLRLFLSPFAWAYARAGRARRAAATPYDPGVPVICVGNASLGGTGKTPVVIYLLESFRRMGIEAVALSRGHGGAQAGPLIVGRDHSAADVGDEPLLLSAVGPTWISKAREDGAAEAVRHGARLIVMDDGHQNPDLVKTLSLVVVDAQVGFGNGRVFPAGPLRETVEEALSRADAIILMMPHADYDPSPELITKFGSLPVIPAWLMPRSGVPAGPLHAFAGIGRPDKFFDSVRRAGGEIVEQTPFADHHRYRPEELQTLALMAKETGATLITTDKDYVRLPTGFRQDVARLPVGVEFGDELTLRRILHPIVSKLSR